MICDGKSFDWDPRRCLSFRCVGPSAKYPASRGYHNGLVPWRRCQVRFPIDAEAFFVEEPGARVEWLRREQSERVAA